MGKQELTFARNQHIRNRDNCNRGGLADDGGTDIGKVPHPELCWDSQAKLIWSEIWQIGSFPWPGSMQQSARNDPKLSSNDQIWTSTLHKYSLQTPGEILNFHPLRSMICRFLDIRECSIFPLTPILILMLQNIRKSQCSKIRKKQIFEGYWGKNQELQKIWSRFVGGEALKNFPVI